MIETDCNSILNSKLNFFNIYNLDNNITTYFSAKYYSDNKNKESIDIPQDVSILFLDIEVYQKNKSIPFRFNESNHPISAISLNFDKEYHCFFLHDKLENLNIWESEFKKDLISGKYIDEDENIHINTYMSEERLIIDAWNKIRNLNPFILSGFNADNFDFPYIYRRLMKLYNNDKSSVDKIISVFEIAELRQNQLLEIPEFTICDILHLYKPREDGGLNFGKKQPSYTLDFVSTAELKLKKFDYKDDNADLNEFYEKNPKQYLFYNLIDVVLCNKLNKKLKHIDLHNSIRRTLKNSFTKSLIGNSTSFDSYVLYENLNLNKYIRFGMATETSKSINKEELIIYPKMVDKKKIIDPSDIDSDEYIDLVSKFKGAHVNDPTPRIIKDGSLIIDLDASSLYPSMMLQSNISFDVYRARIIPPVTYKFLNILEQRVGKQLLDKELINSIHDLCIKFVYDEDVTDKIKTKRNLYYLILHLLQKIFKYSKNIENIYNPKTDSDQYLLKFYLIPLLDILSFIHPNSKSYNDFVYDYLFDFNNLKNIYSHVYVLEEPISTKQKILKLSVDDCLNLISSYSTTIVGTCFEKHENKLGLFTNLLTELFSKRHFYQNEMLKNDENYSFYNSRQKLIKTIMNSIYGVLGLRSFRYSNHHLAQSITAQGQLSIKVAQFITENYLKTREIK